MRHKIYCYNGELVYLFATTYVTKRTDDTLVVK